MSKRLSRFTLLGLAAALLAGSALAQDIVFKDPVGDDNGPGAYKYPTDAVYKAGSFDITEVKISPKGDKVDVGVSVAAALDDPWGMKVGFAVQMVFIFIRTDGKNNYTKGLPGLNIAFDAADGWDKCIIMSPQGPSRVKGEVGVKAAAMAKDIVIPTRTKGVGKTISATVDMKDLGAGDPTKWGYQVVMQSNEGFPDKTDLLTRKVNEYEGQHRFGGGNDGDCDPHAIDILAGSGTGDKSEADEQHKMLAYECGADGSSKKMATLKMVFKK
jgi:carbohydrate-binding DOMON domain-containing protein